MTNTCNAWILPINETQQFAVSEQAIIEYVFAPSLRVVPLTPVYCSFVLHWREKLVPVMNLALLLDLSTTDTAYHVTSHIAVVAYQSAPRTPLQYGAILLNDAPSRISVDDRQACKLPHYFTEKFSPLILSCFSDHDSKIPIVDVAYLYSDALRTKMLNDL